MKLMTSDTKERLVWDIETNGLIGDARTVWCMAITNIDTGEAQGYTDYDPAYPSIGDGIDRLLAAEYWENLNILQFDMPMLEILGYLKPGSYDHIEVMDTLIASQVLYPAIENFTFPGKVPGNLKRSHSLKAWGYRMDCHKGEYNDWSQYTQAMMDYCIQDVVTTAKTGRHLEKRAAKIGVPWTTDRTVWKPLTIEHEFSRYIFQQQMNGFPFNELKANELVAGLLKEHTDLANRLQQVFPPYSETVEYITPKLKQHKTKVIDHVFNPASRDQIGTRLMANGWKPKSFTATGKPVVNESTMAEAAAEGYAGAAEVDKYLTINKLLGQLANGQNSWLKLCKNGRMHGRVKTLGAITTRGTHVKPNMSQVPASGAYKGDECRELFEAEPGWLLVGADLSGIELRALAHYAARWDGGAYGKELLEGDIHTAHQVAFGLPEGKQWRKIGKGGTYCLIYGGGDWKLGHTLQATGTEGQVTAAGKRFRASLIDRIPVLGTLTDAVKLQRKRPSAMGKHFIKGVVGHPLYCRSEHSALNTLLQSFGATVAKTWYVLFHQAMAEAGYKLGRGKDFYTVGFFHDEIQVTCRPEIAEAVGKILLQTAKQTGVVLGIRLPIDAEFTIGRTWKDTH